VWPHAGARRRVPVGPLLSPDGGRLPFARADGDRSGEWLVVDLRADADQHWPRSAIDAPETAAVSWKARHAEHSKKNGSGVHRQRAGQPASSLADDSALQNPDR